jgi:hypothetical protein
MQRTIFVDDDWAQSAKNAITEESAGDAHVAQSAEKHGYHKIDAAQFQKETKDMQPVSLFPDESKPQSQSGQN